MAKPVVRINLILIAAVIIMAVPTIVVSVIGWDAAQSIAMLAAMGGLFSATGLGLRGVAALTIASGVGTFAASFVDANPLYAVFVMFVA
ncbi:MAG: hypothetical protein EBR52_06805, partial [Microbacteriaceae bacterium]|nr:hypothetical protein [Microbacteriaceae bacterium]